MRVICGVQLKDRKRTKDFVIGLKETFFIRSLCYGKQCLLALSCVEERGWSCFEKTEVEGQRKKGRRSRRKKV